MFGTALALATSAIEMRASAHLSCGLYLQVFSFIQAQVTFFHQGSDLLRDLEPSMRTMAAQVLPHRFWLEAASGAIQLA